ncbi:M1 family metallopeptidase [Flavobacteriaceae bacterium 3-367]
MRYLFLIILVHFSLTAYAQSQPKVDFITGAVSLHIDPYAQEVSGEVVYTFDVLEKVDSLFLDARNMHFETVRLNNKKVPFRNSGKTISLKKRLKPGRSYKLSLAYRAKPKQTVYFMGWNREDPISNRDFLQQVWTQGQGKYTSHWLPSFDDMNEKVVYDLKLSFDPGYDIIANGKLKKMEERDSLKLWSFDMEHPMSSYLLAFAIGKYQKRMEVSSSGIPLELYYYPKDSLRAEPTYRYTKRIFDFLEEEIGLAYPWQNYKQIPVKDFLYAGMENTGTTIFSDAYVVDSIAFKDRNYVNVNAHEMAHQWFGNLVTEVDGNHHWLHEGFATYYALLAEQAVFGDAHFFWKLYDTAQQLGELSDSGKGEALVDPKASSLTFYEKGAWALFMLRHRVGNRAFKQGIKNYLQRFKFKNATVEDLIWEMESASDTDLSDFQKVWLQDKQFPFTKAMQTLRASCGDIEQFHLLQRELTTSSESNETIIQRYWDSTESIDLKKRIVSTYHKSLSIDFLIKIFDTNVPQIRQALAVQMEKVPLELKSKFETLLNDQSYVTLENALYKLWVYFPNDRKTYLDQSKKWFGFQNGNVRLLWLTLALLTKAYNEESKLEYYRELRGYTSSNYPFEMRQLAFQWIKEVFDFNDENLRDLIQATTHHTWQFRKYARAMLDKLLKEERYKERIVNLSKELGGKELEYVNSKMQ